MDKCQASPYTTNGLTLIITRDMWYDAQLAKQTAICNTLAAYFNVYHISIYLLCIILPYTYHITIYYIICVTSWYCRQTRYVSRYISIYRPFLLTSFVCQNNAKWPHKECTTCCTCAYWMYVLACHKHTIPICVWHFEHRPLYIRNYGHTVTVAPLLYIYILLS